MERKQFLHDQLSTKGGSQISGWAAMEVVTGQFTEKENRPMIPQIQESDGKCTVVTSKESGQETQRESRSKS